MARQCSGGGRGGERDTNRKGVSRRKRKQNTTIVTSIKNEKNHLIDIKEPP